MNNIGKSSARNSIKMHLVVGAMGMAGLVLGMGGWASLTEISGAVIAQGQLVVDTNVKKVQHSTGGIVGELRVRDGDRVKSGDILIRLDETQTRANLEIIVAQILELAARQARAEAERDGSDAIAFPSMLLARAAEPVVARALSGEQKLFESKRLGRKGQISQLREQTAQLGQEIKGLSAQREAKLKEIQWNQQELKGVRDLWGKNLVQFSRVTALERDGAHLEGERGQLTATIAQVQGRIAETELKILQIDQDLRTEVTKELAEIRSKRAELAERQVAAEDQLRRTDIRAPQDGVVHQLSVHTVGGVITPQGDPIMLIVPEADALVVEAKIQPQDISQTFVGQRAVLRLSSLNQRSTPEISGEVIFLSPDVSQEARTAANYYSVRISVSPSEIDRIEGLRLVPGMPVEVFIQTGLRTAMSYLVRPLTDQIRRAFREK
jgi:HlyD family secretion protein